jgi:hypothetical protein
MRETRKSGSMSGERKRADGFMPALPRLSSTLLSSRYHFLVSRQGVNKGTFLSKTHSRNYTPSERRVSKPHSRSSPPLLFNGFRPTD